MKHGSLIESSREIVNRAIAEYKPYAIGLMLSGGDDSMTALHVCHELGVKLDFIMHGITLRFQPTVWYAFRYANFKIECYEK